MGIVADAFDTIYEAENVTFLVYGSRDPAPNGAIRLLRDGGGVRDLGPQPREASVKLWVQDGLIALGRDARLSLFALFEVLALVVYRVQDILLREDTPRQVALNSSVHFALTILWDAAHAVYGREQGSLFVTAMFHRIFGHYSKPERKEQHRNIQTYIFASGQASRRGCQDQLDSPYRNRQPQTATAERQQYALSDQLPHYTPPLCPECRANGKLSSPCC